MSDSDTRVTVIKIEERNDPLSWFTGDWPLENHFYRPISTLVFELDRVLHPRDGGGYAFTNALLICLCLFGFAWLLRELTDDVLTSAAAMVILGLWLGGYSLFVSNFLYWMVPISFFVGVFRHGFALKHYWTAPILLFLASQFVTPIANTNSFMVNWIPARTASSMAALCLPCLAAFCRGIRLSGRTVSAPAQPSSTDIPATRTSTVAEVAKNPWGWFVLSFALLVGALGCYEQAVMLPACFTVVMVGFALKGYRAPWLAVGLAWGLLIVYIVLRNQILPGDISGYQKQQLRFGGGVWLSLLDYIAPPLAYLPSFLQSVSVGPLIFLTGTPYLFLARFAALPALATRARKWGREFGPELLMAWGLSWVSFFPMAFLKPFDHYHFWPSFFRALLTVYVLKLAGKALLTGWSPQGLQAPQRSNPAPGSLPHP